ncbi:MAG: type I restriction enzyme M protein [Verrucomicrobiales bacterium]|jgi:type I restriction enzyme M protein
MPAAKKKSAKTKQSANLGFEAKLWLAADKLRSNMDAAEYKHVVLGLIFLKYISDAFEEMRGKLAAGEGDYTGAAPEDADEYKAENVFWVPKEARWDHLQSSTKLPEIGKLVDDAMAAIERDNPRLKGVLPKDFARPALDKHRLGELIDLIGTIGLGDAENRSKDILGRVYEYFLSSFASAEGKKGGQFYTPHCIVQTLVEMLAPKPGSRLCDPCCGSGGMFVQSEKFVEEHGGRIGDIAVYGQESNPTTRRLAAMNMAIRGIEADLGTEHADTFWRNLQMLINTRRWHDWISGFSNGTTINMLPKDAFAMPTLVVPPAELVEQFTDTAVNTAAQIEANRLESRTLAALFRDTLLPKLLSGELDVNATDKPLEAAV